MIFSNPVENQQWKIDHFQALAFALTKALSLKEMANLVACECRKALCADAICLYFLKSDDSLEMYAEEGCTELFKKNWRVIPLNLLPLAREREAEDKLFFGTAAEFKTELPSAEDLINHSNRQTIGYAPLRVNRRLIGILGFSYNTAQAQPEDQSFILTLVNLCAQALERIRLTELERIAFREAEAANEAKTSFLANVSHEIRTPLSLIQGYTEMLSEESSLTLEQRQWAAVVLRNVRQLGNIIGDVLDITKIEAERIEIELIEFSLKELLADISSTVFFKAKSKGVKLEFFGAETECTIKSDPSRIRQILLNLISNALKFTPGGAIEVHVKLTGSDLQILVKDSGIGIPLESHQTVFLPFKQVKSKRSRSLGGTGLGLSISRRFARALGGDLQLVHSHPGQGSTFRFHLDHCIVKQNAKLVPSIVPSSDFKALQAMNILLVEDSPDNQYLFKCILSKQGAQVDVAGNGKQALMMIGSGNYDLVLMDIQMPEMDGHEAVRRLRSGGFERPIVALTAHALLSERIQALGEGFNEYLTKPINFPTLIEVIQRLDFRKVGASAGTTTL